MKSWALLLPFVLSACVAKEAGNVGPFDGPAAYYDGDSRQEVSESDRTYLVGQATAMIFDGTRKNFPFLKDMYPLCENERFQDQRVIGFCSGVLVAPNKVLTAAHCMQEASRCENGKFVFGATDGAQNLAIYSCKKVISIDRNLDFAVVELDRTVDDVIPAQVATTHSLNDGDTVLSMSYPLGLPLKQDLGKIKDAAPDKNFFKVAVDTFSGSSGSPLFNRQGEVIGILSRGAEDILEDDIYRVQTKGGCVNFNGCENGQCRGETFLKVSLISDKI
ncbi:serine protease [Bdellovibrio sp. ZAP7]|uniref:trypsin-like serine peptidase n=1 Tax=Bdellovibrio sp. ZAP7 TaxID=2231053 RepID=UPI0011577C91|nr:serine protease [Bdellovibrio sp. ZAP7]QDK47215.1 serine protease [Bdellovibrio sp. ZAP7]